MEEIWKTVKDYEGLYEVSNLGRVKSLKRKWCKGQILKGSPIPNPKISYLGVSLSNIERLTKYIHILVYEAFVGQIPKGYDVHHKNHNPLDNRLENLELLKESEHCKENNEKRIKRVIEKCSKTVMQCELDGTIVKEYCSATEASKETKIPISLISRCCNGKRKTSGGYKWKYKENNEDVSG